MVCEIVNLNNTETNPIEMDNINPENARKKELLKHMILQLHNGEAPDEVRGRLVELLKSIPYNEVVEVEQELINEGLPEEEVLQFCDIHPGPGWSYRPVGSERNSGGTPCRYIQKGKQGTNETCSDSE